MRTVALAAVLAASCAHAGAGEPKSGGAPDIFSTEVRAAHDHPAGAMTLARTPLALDNRTMVRTCAEYLSARRAGVGIAESTDARLAASEYVVCEAMDVLRCATRGAPGMRGGVGRELAARVDLRQLRTSFGPRLDEQTHTLVALGDKLQTTETSVSVVRDDWSFVLRLVAVADVDADGRSDWIVSLADEARGGTYRDYGVAVAFAPDTAGVLRAVRWPLPARPCRGE